MNDFYFAAIAAGAAALLFLVSVLRRNRDGEHRIWTGLGLACLALTFALAFFTLGNTIDRIGDAAAELGQSFSDLGNLDDPTVSTDPLPTFPEGSGDNGG